MRANRETPGYRSSLEERLPELVAVFAHELSHYIIAAAGDDGPGGPTMDEPLTDLCSVFMGFGVFSTNAALHPLLDADIRLRDVLSEVTRLRFQKLAYLSQEELAYALAISAILLDCSKTVSKQLTLPARIQFNRALRHLRENHRDRIEHLRFIEGRNVRDEPHPIAFVKAAALREIRVSDKRKWKEEKKKRRRRFSS